MEMYNGLVRKACVVCKKDWMWDAEKVADEPVCPNCIKMETRYAISSFEEIWVKVCYRFFERNGYYDWYEVDMRDAFNEMMEESNGNINPIWLKERIKKLYESVGIYT
jgi:hypothetical protein